MTKHIHPPIKNKYSIEDLERDMDLNNVSGRTRESLTRIFKAQRKIYADKQRSKEPSPMKIQCEILRLETSIDTLCWIARSYAGSKWKDASSIVDLALVVADFLDEHRKALEAEYADFSDK